MKTVSLILLTSFAFAWAGNSEVAKKLNGWSTECANNAEARANGHSEKALYERLGGYGKIHVLVEKIIENHTSNPNIKHIFENVDLDNLAHHVSHFVASGTGGTQGYEGKSMPEAHAHLKLTDTDFVEATEDIVKAMKSLKYGQNEIDEITCILMSLKDQVVLP